MKKTTDTITPTARTRTRSRSESLDSEISTPLPLETVLLKNKETVTQLTENTFRLKSTNNTSSILNSREAYAYMKKIGTDSTPPWTLSQTPKPATTTTLPLCPPFNNLSPNTPTTPNNVSIPTTPNNVSIPTTPNTISNEVPTIPRILQKNTSTLQRPSSSSSSTLGLPPSSVDQRQLKNRSVESDVSPTTTTTIIPTIPDATLTPISLLSKLTIDTLDSKVNVAVSNENAEIYGKETPIQLNEGQIRIQTSYSDAPEQNEDDMLGVASILINSSSKSAKNAIAIIPDFATTLNLNQTYVMQTPIMNNTEQGEGVPVFKQTAGSYGSLLKNTLDSEIGFSGIHYPDDFYKKEMFARALCVSKPRKKLFLVLCKYKENLSIRIPRNVGISKICVPFSMVQLKGVVSIRDFLENITRRQKISLRLSEMKIHLPNNKGEPEMFVNTAFHGVDQKDFLDIRLNEDSYTVFSQLPQMQALAEKLQQHKQDLKQSIKAFNHNHETLQATVNANKDKIKLAAEATANNPNHLPSQVLQYVSPQASAVIQSHKDILDLKSSEKASGNNIVVCVCGISGPVEWADSFCVIPQKINVDTSSMQNSDHETEQGTVTSLFRAYSYSLAIAENSGVGIHLSIDLQTETVGVKPTQLVKLFVGRGKVDIHCDGSCSPLTYAGENDPQQLQTHSNRVFVDRNKMKDIFADNLISISNNSTPDTILFSRIY
jgi:hypothetical protein